MDLTVIMDTTATPAEVEAVRGVLRDHGFEGDVSAGLEVKAVDVSSWVTYVSLSAPLGAFLARFASSAGEAAGKEVGAAVGRTLVKAGAEGWQLLKAFVQQLYAARKRSTSGSGEVFLRIERVVEMSTPEGLPDLAWRQLAEMKIERSESGLLRWSWHEERWMDSWSLPD